MFTGRGGRTLVDIFMSQHPHFLEMHDRRRQLDDGSETPLWFVSAEDLCVMKLFYGRSKDVPDLERLFAALPEMDRSYIRHWLLQMVRAGDRRIELLDELERRFSAG